MDNRDLIRQYVNTGIGIPRYQFDKLSNNKRTPLEFVKIDIDESPDICEYFDITSLPTFIKIENNKQVNKIVGCNTHELERIVNS
jgi:thioredoxin-like negative regulator of GroEL